MAENKLKQMDATAAEQQLKNLKNLLKDFEGNSTIRAMIKKYLNEDTNVNVPAYLAERYELDENVVKKYLEALREQAEKHLKNINKLEKANKYLEKNLNKISRQANNNFVLKILFPILVYHNLAESFGVSHSIFFNEYKKLAQQYISEAKITGYNNLFLNNLESLLKNEDELTEGEQYNVIVDDLAIVGQYMLSSEESAFLIEAVADNSIQIEEEITTDAYNNVKLQLTEKINKKDIDNEQLDKFEWFCANQLYLHEADYINMFTAKLNIVHDAEVSGFTNKLTFNLMRELFPGMKKEEYAKLATLAYMSQNLYEHNDVNEVLDKENVSEKEATCLFEKYVKSNPEVEAFYKNTLNSVYGIDTSELNFNKNVTEKLNKNLEVEF